MANEKEPAPGTRGYRINEFRKALGLSREAFGEALASIAADHHLDAAGKWTLSRVSQTILERKPIPLDDMAAIILLARARGQKGVTWDWVVFGRDAKKTKLPVSVTVLPDARVRRAAPQTEAPGEDDQTDKRIRAVSGQRGKPRGG